MIATAVAQICERDGPTIPAYAVLDVALVGTEWALRPDRIPASAFPLIVYVTDLFEEPGGKTCAQLSEVCSFGETGDASVKGKSAVLREASMMAAWAERIAGSRRLICLGTALIGAIGATAAHGQTLQDGGFESQGASIGDWCYIGNGCPSGAWSGTGGLARQGGAYTWKVPASTSAPISAFLQGQGYVQQTMVASKTALWRVVWYAAGRSAVGSATGNQNIVVSINGSALGSVFGTSATTSGSPFVRQVSAAFQMVSGQSYTLKFAGNTAADNTAFIDSVRVVEVQEQQQYTYDALGRLIGAATTGGINDGRVANYQLDKTNNRSSVTVQGSN